jgi:hypothetical protein
MKLFGGKDKDKKKKKKGKPDARKVRLPISPLDQLVDPEALVEAEDIIRRAAEGKINLVESLKLLVLAMVSHEIDHKEALRAMHRAAKEFFQTSQYGMMVQAMKHLADEVQWSADLDTLAIDHLRKMVTGEEMMITFEKDEEGKEEMQVCSMPPKDRIAAFREIRNWRKDKLDFALTVIKLFAEIERFQRYIQMMDELVQASISGPRELESKIKALPPEDRRDVAILVRWMVKAKNVDTEGLMVYLKDDGTRRDTEGDAG